MIFLQSLFALFRISDNSRITVKLQKCHRLEQLIWSSWLLNIVTIDKRKGTTAEQSPRTGLPLFFIIMIESLILTDFSLNKRVGEY